MKKNIIKPLISSTLFLLLLGYHSILVAQSWYQVEVIVFERINPAVDGELFQEKAFNLRDDALVLQTVSSLEQVPYSILDKDKNNLNASYRFFQLSNDFNPLYHVSWQQKATERREAKYVRIGTTRPQRPESLAEQEWTEPDFIEEVSIDDRTIEGVVRIRSGFYLHADIEVAYLTNLLDMETKPSPDNQSRLKSLNKTTVKLKESRKIKLNEVHYFDHPLFGLILQVTRLKKS